MHSKTDMKKSLATFPVIDWILVGLIIFTLLFIGYTFIAVGILQRTNLHSRIADLNTQASQLDVERSEVETEIASLENDLTQEQEKLAKLQAAADALNSTKADALVQTEEIEAEIAFSENLTEEIENIYHEYGLACRALEDEVLAGNSPYRICYLTFDDGPSYSTERFLDKLDELDVKATFFTIGVELPEYSYELRDSCLRREAASGHVIANHTYTHAYYGPLYDTVDSFMDAVCKQDALVFSQTGLHTKIVRFPSGSNYCRLLPETLEALHAAGFTYIDWSANSFDAGAVGASMYDIISAVTFEVQQEEISVVLMHDWIQNTLDSLDQIVPALRAKNYVFLPLFPESSTMEITKPKWDGGLALG